jgi:hypothetical protein
MCHKCSVRRQENAKAIKTLLKSTNIIKRINSFTKRG